MKREEEKRKINLHPTKKKATKVGEVTDASNSKMKTAVKKAAGKDVVEPP